MKALCFHKSQVQFKLYARVLSGADRVKSGKTLEYYCIRAIICDSQLHKYKYINTQIQIHKYKYINTNTQIQKQGPGYAP